METILSTIFGWAIVIAGVFLIVIIIQLIEWWQKRKGGTRTPPEIPKNPPPTVKHPEPPETRISEPQAPYYSRPPPSSIPELIPHPFDYQAEWWKVLSKWYRDQKNWRCEECKISLINDRYYLHTHHIWGTQYNEPKDLKALCLGCHAEQPGRHHHMLRKTEDYKHFMKKYGKQWRMSRCE